MIALVVLAYLTLALAGAGGFGAYRLALLWITSRYAPSVVAPSVVEPTRRSIFSGPVPDDDFDDDDLDEYPVKVPDGWIPVGL